MGHAEQACEFLQQFQESRCEKEGKKGLSDGEQVVFMNV
jgi:hypothetical protein